MKITVLHARQLRDLDEFFGEDGPLPRSMFVEVAILEVSEEVPEQEVLGVVYAHTQNIDEPWNQEAP